MAVYWCGSASAKFTFSKDDMQRAKQALIDLGLLLSEAERVKLAQKLATDSPLSQEVIDARHETY